MTRQAKRNLFEICDAKSNWKQTEKKKAMINLFTLIHTSHHLQSNDEYAMFFQIKNTEQKRRNFFFVLIIWNKIRWFAHMRVPVAVWATVCLCENDAIPFCPSLPLSLYFPCYTLVNLNWCINFSTHVCEANNT